MDRGYESFGLLEVTVEQLYVSSYTLIRLTILADQGTHLPPITERNCDNPGFNDRRKR